MTSYRVYYDDKTVYEFSDNDPLPANKRMGVIVVVYPEPTHEWGFWHSKDYYIMFTTGEWIGVDEFGMIDNVIHKSEAIKYVLSGRTVTYELFQDILVQAQKDCRPPKTGWFSNER